MAFPTTSVLTTFTGADEEDLSEGGDWQANPIQVGPGRCRRISNEADTKFAGGDCQSVWATEYAADQEVFATITEVPTSGQSITVWFGIVGPNTAGVDAYLAAISGAATNNLSLFKCINSSVSAIGTPVTQAASIGHKLGGRRTGTTLELWYDTGSGWTVRDSMTNSEVTGDGFIGIELFEGGRFDNFGGGETVSETGGLYYVNA